MSDLLVPEVIDLDQKITGVGVWHLSLPVVSRRDHGIGSVSGHMEVVVVRLDLDNGLSGFGEAAPWAVFTGTPEASFAAIDRYFRPHLLGSRLGDLQSTLGMIQKIVVHCTEAKSAVESALLDLAGQVLEKPVWQLFGSRCRERIPMSVSLANPDFDEDKKLLERLADDGIRMVKLKTGFKSDEFDLMRASYIRENHPEFNLRIDYNQGLDRETALDSTQLLDAVRPDFIEQPVVAHDYQTMARIRSAINSPLLADESVFGPEDMHRAIRERICDGVSIKVMKSGGIIRGMAIAEIAEDNGLPAYGGDMFETGLAHLAGIHMIAVACNIKLGCEFYHSKYYLFEDLLTQPLRMDKGNVCVPEDPGLGYTVNPHILEKYSIKASLT